MAPDVLLLVFLSHLNIPAVGFELVRGDLTQDLFVDGEEHLQTALFYVVIPWKNHGS